jgi:hypothetical protein
MTKPSYIDGPSNVIRLEKDGKTVCIFVNSYDAPLEQILCSEPESLTIKDYLMRELDDIRDEVNVVIDFTDAYLEELMGPNYEDKGYYVTEIVNMLSHRLSSNLHLHALYREDTYGNDYLYANIDSFIDNFVETMQSISDQQRVAKLLLKRLEKISDTDPELLQDCGVLLEKLIVTLEQLSKVALEFGDAYGLSEQKTQENPPRLFLNPIGTYYSYYPEYVDKMKIKTMMNDLIDECVSYWRDYNRLFSALSIMRSMLKWERTIVYARQIQSYRLLQILIRNGYRITNCAFSRAPDKDINDLLPSLPIQEYALLLTPHQKGLDIPIQCSNISDFPPLLSRVKPQTSEIQSATRKVDGPVNVLRLEGSINGIKKVVYLFFEYHLDPDIQTSCPNGDGEDVRDYIVRQTIAREETQVKKPVDFFMEIPIIYHSRNSKSSVVLNYDISTYIQRLRVLFSEIHQHRIDNTSSPLENLRVHYLDIRDTMRYFYKYEYMLPEIILGGFGKLVEYAKNDQVRKYIDIQLENIIFIKNILSGAKIDSEYLANLTQEQRSTINVLLKIQRRYAHPEIRKALQPWIERVLEMNIILEKYLHNMSEWCQKVLDIHASVGVKLFPVPHKSIGYQVEIPDRLIFQLENEISILKTFVDSYSLHLYALLTDIYLIRRLLDKDMITNAIVYSGAHHSSNYLEILVKGFDFKVTHVSHLFPNPLIPDVNTLDLEDLNKYVKNNEFKDIALLFEPVLTDSINVIQCSDLSSFPLFFD